MASPPLIGADSTSVRTIDRPCQSHHQARAEVDSHVLVDWLARGAALCSKAHCSVVGGRDAGVDFEL